MIWVIGGNGMLGHEVCASLSVNRLSMVSTDVEVDITDIAALTEFARSVEDRIDWIINCSAYTAVDQAEDEQEKAFAINADGVRNIALTAGDLNARFIHLSTDYVFDGTSKDPYVETDTVNPTSAYGKSKAEGESLLIRECDAHVIVRTAWLYGYYGKNFVATMVRLMNEKDSVSVVADQHGSPTYAPHLADAIHTIITSARIDYGIYHFTNMGETTWFDFACEIYAVGRSSGIITSECEITPIPTSAYPTKATRPAFSYMSKEKIMNSFGLTIPSWKEGLSEYMQEVKKNA